MAVELRWCKAVLLVVDEDVDEADVIKRLAEDWIGVGIEDVIDVVKEVVTLADAGGAIGAVFFCAVDIDGTVVVLATVGASDATIVGDWTDWFDVVVLFKR